MVANEITTSAQKISSHRKLAAIATVATLLASPVFAGDVTRTDIDKDLPISIEPGISGYYNINVDTLSNNVKVGTTQVGIGSNAKDSLLDLKATGNSLTIVSRESSDSTTFSNRAAIYADNQSKVKLAGNQLYIEAAGGADKTITGISAKSSSAIEITGTDNITVSAENIAPNPLKRASLFGINANKSNVSVASDKTLDITVKNLAVDETAEAVHAQSSANVSLSGKDLIVGVETTDAHKALENRIKDIFGVNAKTKSKVSLTSETLRMNLGNEASTIAVKAENTGTEVNIKANVVDISANAALIATTNGKISLETDSGKLNGRMSATNGGSIDIKGNKLNYIGRSTGNVIEELNKTSMGKDLLKSSISLDVGSVDLSTEGSVQATTASGTILLESLATVDIKADSITLTQKSTAGVNRAAVWLQGNTQLEETPAGRATLTLNADTVNITSGSTGLIAYSNAQFTVNGNLNLTAKGPAIDTRGNAVIRINEDGAHTTVINGDIAFETPATTNESHSSGGLINSNVTLNLTGTDSVWNGRAYQQRGADAEKTFNPNTDDIFYGKVTGFKATLADGGIWNVTGDSFVNSLTLKNGGIVNASDAVKTLNIGDLTIEGTGNELSAANVSGTVSFADGAGLTTALNTAYTVGAADKLGNGAINNATGRLTLGTVGKDASLNISDAFTYTQAGLDAITSAYNGLTINLDNASLYINPASEDKEFNIDKGTIGLIAKGDEAITGGAESLKVGGDAVLNVKSSATTNVATATDITVNGTMNVTDASLSADTLNVAENAQVNIGTPTSAGELHVAELTSAAGSKIFLDPAWQDGATIADASFMSAASLTGNTIEGDIAVGQNSVVALNASKAAAVNAFNKTGLTWGADDVTAALFIGAPTTVSGSINVDGTMTADTDAPYGTSGFVSIQNHGLLMVDQTGVGSSAAINGPLTLASGSYVGIANADAGSVTLATEVADDGATVVTDNPFLEGAINGNAVDVSISPTGGLGALASTGIQAMTRRADTILAQTIADRTSVDQELAAGTNLWVDVTGERYEADKLDNGGEFKSDMGYGAFGADFAVTQDITAGAAFQYGKGSLRSGVSSIKNSIDSYGVTAYGAMKFGDAKVVAEASYIKNENDITSSQTALNQSVDSEIYSVGVRGQHRFTAGNFQFVPSVGVRVSRLNTDAMQVGAVNIKKQEQTLVQVPIALRVNGFEQNVNGWSVAPSFKVAYVPTFGDKEISVLGADQTVIDTSPVQGDFGIRAQNGNLMVNANMMLGGGKDGTSSVGGKVGLKYVF